MRQRKEFLVITFSETTDAIAAEKLLPKHGIPGRIIPIPRQLSAGCGLSWKTDMEWEDRAREALEAEGIRWQEMEPVTLWA